MLAALRSTWRRREVQYLGAPPSCPFPHDFSTFPSFLKGIPAGDASKWSKPTTDENNLDVKSWHMCCMVVKSGNIPGRRFNLLEEGTISATLQEFRCTSAREHTFDAASAEEVPGL